MIRADLHTHTFYSDGGQSPSDIIYAAKSRGVNLISVTDHDNSVCVDEVRALGKKAGVLTVDGIEISAYEQHAKVHILGYGMDTKAAAYVKFCKELYDGSETRTFDILQKLARVNVDISYGEVLRERRSKKAPMHAVYISQAATRKGYASSPYAFYIKYLNYGQPGYSDICRPTPEASAEVITQCGGICSLAHPGRISMDKDGIIALVEKLIPHGLAGIEAVYSGHTDSETQYYKEMAEKYNLLVTGGSDTHFSEGNRAVGTPPFYPDDKLLAALKIN